MTDDERADRQYHAWFVKASRIHGKEIERMQEAAARAVEYAGALGACHRQIGELEGRLSEAEALLRKWRKVADIAKDMTFVPIAKQTDAWLARRSET